jgi:hypothetical protein
MGELGMIESECGLGGMWRMEGGGKGDAFGMEIVLAFEIIGWWCCLARVEKVGLFRGRSLIQRRRDSSP